MEIAIKSLIKAIWPNIFKVPLIFLYLKRIYYKNAGFYTKLNVLGSLGLNFDYYEVPPLKILV